jgi:hypothetical protein
MMDQFPPAGYMKVESTIEGIEVFQPAPAEAAEPEKPVLDFTCPQCGATVAYNIPSGGLRCEHCGYIQKPQAEIAGKKAEKLEFTPAALEKASQGWGTERMDLVCESCGAQTSLPVDMLTHSCAFCGSNKVIHRQAAQDSLRPRFLIPFQVDENASHKIVQGWLGSSWMTPAGLKALANLKAFSKFYLPFWTFGSVTSASWKAEVGHTRTEQYYDHGSKSWRTRTRIDWRWESGQVRLNIDDLLISGTDRVSARHLKSIRNYDLRALAAYDPMFLAGLSAKSYDIPLEAAWETARQEMREKTRQACRGQASTGNIRNFSMNLDFSEESWRYVLLPVYLAAYRYGNQAYQAVLNGQTGTISGQRPVDWTRVWVVIAVLLFPGLLLSLLGLVTLPLAGVGVVIGGIGLTLLIAGLVAGIIILVKANQLDDA